MAESKNNLVLAGQSADSITEGLAAQEHLIGGIGLLPAAEEERVVRDLIYRSFLLEEEEKAFPLMSPEFKGKARPSSGKVMTD
ncbi:hypothetical protein [Thermogemmatispora carboxidivorans]|uniref:hypothetical protein n=1 Tax=Thermogemmatispora carboxidivorans TaxID=1382306 RepID=UPI00069992A3|nr:hypothetical protein [Thermogemmatispora carboxidivorans]